MLKRNGPGQCCCGGICPKINEWDNVWIDAAVTITDTWEQSVPIEGTINPWLCENRYDMFCGDTVPSPPGTIELICGRGWLGLYEYFKYESGDTYQATWGQYNFWFYCDLFAMDVFYTIREMKLASDATKRYLIADIRAGADADIATSDDRLPIYRCIDGVLETYGDTYMRAFYRSATYTVGTGTSHTLTKVSSGHDTRFRFGQGTMPSTITAYTL